MKIKNKIELLYLLLGICLYISLPGLVPWINDEPFLLANAKLLNDQGGLATLGLYGSKNLPFGAVPTLFYQFLLLFTNDLLLIVQLKAIIFVVIIFFSAKVIIERLNLPRDLILLPLLSPFVFHYSRTLWDNCLLVPITFMAMALTISFLQEPSKIKIAWLGFLVILLVQTHLISILFILPLVVLIFVFRRQWIKQNIILAAAIFVVTFAVNYPYLELVVKNLSSSSNTTDYIYLSQGAFYFSSFRFFDYFVPEVYDSQYAWVYLVLALLSCLVFIFLIGQVVVSFKQVAKKKSTEFRDVFTAYCLLSIILAIILSSFLKLEAHPHYLNALAIYFLIPIFMFLGQLNKYFRYSYMLLLFISVIAFQAFIYSNQGTKSYRYGATLSNQLDIVREISQYQDSVPIRTTVKNYVRFPHSLRILRYHFTNFNQKTEKEARMLMIEYIENSSSKGRVKVKEHD